MNCGIYRITNIITGDFYIGQSTEISKRKRAHFGMLRRNNHDNIHLQRAYNRDGKENFSFEILIYCEEFELNRYEQLLVNKLKPSYNIMIECINSRLGIKASEETKNKLIESHLGNSSALGHHPSDEAKKKMSEGHKGLPSPNKNKTASLETREKLSKAHKGKKLNFSYEHRKKLSEANKGQIHSKEQDEKHSAFMKLYWKNKKELGSKT